MIALNQRIAAYMGDTLNLDGDDREVIAYSLELLFHTTSTIFLVLIIAWLIGTLREAVVLLILMFLFKNFAGGAHCSSAGRCMILSMLLIPSLTKLSHIVGQHCTLNFLISLTALSILFSYAIVYKLAPVNLPIVSPKHRQSRRNLSFLFLMLIIIIQITLITFIPFRTATVIVAIDIGISWQAFVLTKQGHALVNCFDRWLFRFLRKGGENNEIH